MNVMRAHRWLLVAAALILSTACGQRGPGREADDDGGRVVAAVGKKKIFERELDQAVATLPQHRQAEFAGARGRMRLLDQIVQRELFVQEALATGLDSDPEVAKQLEDFRVGLLMQAYHRKLVESLPVPTEADLRRYYDEHPQEFVILARINASWIKCKRRADAEKARKRIVEGGEHFGTVAREVSIDEATKQDGGLLGYFNPRGYIRGIGDRPEFARQAFDLEVDDVGPVFEWDGGWGFIKVHEKMSERADSFTNARERIAARLRPTLTDSLLQAEIGRLSGKFKVEKYIDIDRELQDKSADELMRLATEAGDPMDKIEYYRALLRKYPQYERADDAQFMIGFVFSEELHDNDAARAEYQKVLDHYPESDVRESALYMMQNLGKSPLPDFEDEIRGENEPVGP